MATVDELIARIREKGANVVIDEGKLRVVNSSKLSPEALSYIGRHASQIADWLDREAAVDERAAIIEHDGGVPRIYADGLARLLQACPPAEIEPADWSWFVGLAARIIDSASTRAAA